MSKKYKVLNDGFVWELVSNKDIVVEFLRGNKAIYALYPDDTESLIGDYSELIDIKKGEDVLFGIETPMKIKKYKNKTYVLKLNKITSGSIFLYKERYYVNFLTDYGSNSTETKKFNGANLEVVFNMLINRTVKYYKRLTKGL